MHLLFELSLANGMRNMSTDGKQLVCVAALVDLQHLSNSSKPIVRFNFAFMIWCIASDFSTTCKYDTPLLEVGLDFVFVIGL